MNIIPHLASTSQPEMVYIDIEYSFIKCGIITYYLHAFQFPALSKQRMIQNEKIAGV